MTDTLPTRIQTIRERALAHQEELESQRWWTPKKLAERWSVSVSTIYGIPANELSFKTFGRGKRFPRRRYSPAAVAQYEAAGGIPKQGAA